MSEEVCRAATSGDLAVFFLIAGISPPSHRGVARFTIDGHGSGTRDEAVKSLNAASKPVTCRARLVGRTLEITTELITNPDALRVRQQYLHLSPEQLMRFGGPPPPKESELVLLKSEDDELIVNGALLQRFYEEYVVPYSSSQSEEDLKAYGSFAAVIRVGASGSAEVYWEDESTGEEES